MASAVGINPVLVLAAVFIGAQVAGAFGAIFGVPVVAVIVSLFERTWTGSPPDVYAESRKPRCARNGRRSVDRWSPAEAAHRAIERRPHEPRQRPPPSRSKPVPRAA